MACQNVTGGHPNKAGTSQFHKSITTAPPTAIKAAIPTIAAGAIQISLFVFFLMW
jgi:hypothetical protein